MVLLLIIGLFLAYAIVGIALSLLFEIVHIKTLGDEGIESDMRVFNMLFWPVISPYRFGHLLIECYYRKCLKRYFSELDKIEYELRVARHKIEFIKTTLGNSNIDTKFIDEFKYTSNW